MRKIFAINFISMSGIKHYREKVITGNASAKETAEFISCCYKFLNFINTLENNFVNIFVNF